MEANGVKDEDVKNANMAMIFGLTFLFALVMAANLAAFLSGPDTTIAWGATADGLTGIGWVALSIGTLALIERRPWKHTEINGGYFAASFIIMGVILGAWR